MRLLISAYACAPDRGSEHAVGWTWITQAARAGHDVTALCSPVHRDAILAASGRDPDLRAITWCFPDVPGWDLAQGCEPAWERTYNLLWQCVALTSARNQQMRGRFDVVHHLTWAGLRAPTFLGSLGAPLVIGPIGGGETTPPLLRKAFSARARITEVLRDVSNRTVALNPILRPGLRKAVCIATKTSQTTLALPATWRAKCFTYISESISPDLLAKSRHSTSGAPKLLFVGRLLYWKGVDLLVDGFSAFHALRPDATLTILGEGPEKKRMIAAFQAKKLGHAVRFLPQRPRHAVPALYDEHDLFLFPSLHDSGGTVVLEALARGLPVLCLDLGGPALIATSAAAVIISTHSRTHAEVVRSIAGELDELFALPESLTIRSAASLVRAKDFRPTERVVRFYETVAQICNVPEPAASPGPGPGAKKADIAA